MACTKGAASVATEAFSSRKTNKYYIALVRGFVSQELIDIEMPIGTILIINKEVSIIKSFFPKEWIPDQNMLTVIECAAVINLIAKNQRQLLLAFLFSRKDCTTTTQQQKSC